MWNECGMACLKTCADPNPMCTKNCVPRCQCPTDKPIWKDGKCVTINDCDSKDCKGGMVFEECGSRCTRTCKDKNPTCVEVCEPKCQCPKDKPYLYKGSVCIPEEKCPEKPDPGLLLLLQFHFSSHFLNLKVGHCLRDLSFRLGSNCFLFHAFPH